MNTCLRVLKETKWILSFQHLYLKFIEYFPDDLSALSRTLLRYFWTTFVETAVYAGDFKVPPRVLASGPKPCGGNDPLF